MTVGPSQPNCPSRLITRIRRRAKGAFWNDRWGSYGDGAGWDGTGRGTWLTRGGCHIQGWANRPTAEQLQCSQPQAKVIRPAIVPRVFYDFFTEYLMNYDIFFKKNHVHCLFSMVSKDSMVPTDSKSTSWHLVKLHVKLEVNSDSLCTSRDIKSGALNSQTNIIQNMRKLKWSRTCTNSEDENAMEI